MWFCSSVSFFENLISRCTLPLIVEAYINVIETLCLHVGDKSPKFNSMTSTIFYHLAALQRIYLTDNMLRNFPDKLRPREY